MEGFSQWYSMPLSASPWPIQMAAILLLFAFGLALVWKFIGWQTNSVGHTFADDYWPEIKKSPYAVVAYRLGVYLMPTLLACYILSRFA